MGVAYKTHPSLTPPTHPSQDQTLQLYDVCLSVIQSYARSATGKYSTVAMEEEQQCEDLLLFMKMMTHLTIKDYVDFGAKGDGETEYCVCHKRWLKKADC